MATKRLPLSPAGGPRRKLTQPARKNKALFCVDHTPPSSASTHGVPRQPGPRKTSMSAGSTDCLAAGTPTAFNDTLRAKHDPQVKDQVHFFGCFLLSSWVSPLFPIPPRGFFRRCFSGLAERLVANAVAVTTTILHTLGPKAACMLPATC